MVHRCKICEQELTWSGHCNLWDTLVQHLMTHTSARISTPDVDSVFEVIK